MGYYLIKIEASVRYETFVRSFSPVTRSRSQNNACDNNPSMSGFQAKSQKSIHGLLTQDYKSFGGLVATVAVSPLIVLKTFPSPPWL
jgi:hypothetical protein